MKSIEQQGCDVRNRLPQTFWTTPSTASVNITHKELRALIFIDFKIIAHGKVWEWNYKKLFADIYELSLLPT
jgi:hypothetical protein